MLKKVALAVAAALAAQAASAASIDFHGYLRTQVGGSTQGGNLQCFGIGKKYRLGNECDQYLETAFDTKLYKGNDGVWSNYHLRLAIQQPDAADYETATVASRENWVEAGGFFGEGVFKNAKIWLGKRFYNRNDIHINDYYYWANTGQGAGIENIEFGPVKFAYAYHQTGRNGTNDASVKRHEARFYDIPVNPNGKLEVAAELWMGSSVDLESTAADESSNDENGYSLVIQHVQNGLLGGYNKAAFIYGSGNLAQGATNGWWPWGGYSNDPTVSDDLTGWGLYEQFMFAPAGTNLSGMVAAVYEKQEDDRGGANAETTYWSVGARPQYNFTENFSLAVEAGYEHREPTTGPDQKLFKFTVAPQLTAGKGFWARPAFRVFASYFDGENVSGGVFQEAGATDFNGFTYGAQVEAWW